MTNITKSRAAGVLLAFVLTLFTGLGLVAPAQATTLAADCGDTSAFTEVALSSLPAEATDTYELIQQGGPYPHDQDGTVFQNREGLLPDCSSGYYHEYTVETPGSDDRGARRIVTGAGDEYFYTGDHYESFDLVDVDS
jgi:ribonuclease T1